MLEAASKALSARDDVDAELDAASAALSSQHGTRAGRGGSACCRQGAGEYARE